MRDATVLHSQLELFRYFHSLEGHFGYIDNVVNNCYLLQQGLAFSGAHRAKYEYEYEYRAEYDLSCETLWNVAPALAGITLSKSHMPFAKTLLFSLKDP